MPYLRPGRDKVTGPRSRRLPRPSPPCVVFRPARLLNRGALLLCRFACPLHCRQTSGNPVKPGPGIASRFKLFFRFDRSGPLARNCPFASRRLQPTVGVVENAPAHVICIWHSSQGCPKCAGWTHVSAHPNSVLHLTQYSPRVLSVCGIVDARSNRPQNRREHCLLVRLEAPVCA
ncbi:hypothetical protein IWZ00DRAFT_151230 [Phyllosticta capitalensis]